MRMKTTTTLLATVMTFAAAPLLAGTWDGTIKVGGITIDETGDKSAVQETFNIHDGFDLNQIRLNGAPTPDHYFSLNLRNINLDGRQGDFLYRRPGMFRLTASLDEHRQVFDPDRAINSNRRDWNFGARLTPVKWLRLSGYYHIMTRTGDRLAYPNGTPTPFAEGTQSALGTGYDYTLNSGGISAEVRKNRRGLAADFRATDFTDDLNIDADRTGTVFSVRAFSPCVLYDKLTHLVRFTYGKSELSNLNDVNYTLTKFQYTGVVRPLRRFEFKYDFDAQRVDDKATGVKTDRMDNTVDATYFHANGSVFAGYGYETNDGEELTSYHSWRAGSTFRNDTYTAKIDYAGRIKRDEENLTLLRDIEASRLRAELAVKPVTGLDLSGSFNDRSRDFPDIDVTSEGQTVRSTVGYTYPNWGRVSGTYTYSNDKYEDKAGDYNVNSNAVTARVDFDRVRDLRLSSGVTYLKTGKDLDIEKSILFFEGLYTVQKDLHFEVKYNIYNYDDYILLDRYYTANVVWFNVAYDLHGK